MRDVISAVVGKGVRSIARLRGGGSALPGLVVEKLDPGFLARSLGRLPYGVVVVSGTNGKTTTTKMLVEILEAQGLRVFTNRTGSNFSRGVVAAMVQECSWRGRLAADIAVLELDEAHAMYFIDRVPPRYTLLLNVLRDQLDRFGEIDTTAKLLQRIADTTTEGLVVNREDPLVRAIGTRTSARQRAGEPEVRYFGLSPSLRAIFPSDDDFHSVSLGADHPAPGTGAEPGADLEPAAAVELAELGDHRAVFRVGDERFDTSLQLEGLYNTFNAAAALATAQLVLDRGSATREAAVGAAVHRDAGPASAALSALVAALAEVRPAFGRGERLELDGRPLDLVLVKNPAGFRLGLASFDPSRVSVMIAINDQYADGRDMSWLWDVDFDSLRAEGVEMVSGTRAWDMALRLEHDDVAVRGVVPDLAGALREFREQTAGGTGARRIYCTYTAMLELRRLLAEVTEVEEVW